MAATALTVQNIVRTGLNPTFSAANADGHYFTNDGKKTFIYVKNGSGGSITVTLDITQTVDGQEVTDRTVAIPAGEERVIGPFPVAYYGASANITFSGVTSLTIAAMKVSDG
jgi:hypothetical protein